LPSGYTVLEPSAGDGAFVRAILEANPDGTVVAVEPNASRAAQLPVDPRVEVVRSSFEDFAAEDGRRFDAIVMNPPFSVTDNRTIWIDHVNLAWSVLAPGGRLVAIVPMGMATRVDRRHRDMRELVEQHGAWAELEADACKASGTGIRTALLWLDRPADAVKAVA